MWAPIMVAKIQTFLRCLCYTTYRLQLAFLENPGEDEASKRHRHDEDKGERQGGFRRLHHPQSHDACQLDYGEHVHPPCLHLEVKGVEDKRTSVESCTERCPAGTLHPKLVPCFKTILGFGLHLVDNHAFKWLSEM